LRRAGPRWPVRALGALAAALLAAVVAVPIAQKARTVNRLEGQIAAVRGDALKAQALRDEIAQQVGRERALLVRRLRRPPAIDVLRELSALLPEGTWLSQLEFSGSRVKLRGESANASELVTLIENSAMFRNVAFEGSVTRDPSSTGERFAISAAAEPPAKP
jgi:general secretion pathway protein L